MPPEEEFKEIAQAQNKLVEILDKFEWFLGCGVGMNVDGELQLSLLIDSTHPEAEEATKKFASKAIGKFKIIPKLQNKETLFNAIKSKL